MRLRKFLPQNEVTIEVEKSKKILENRVYCLLVISLICCSIACPRQKTVAFVTPGTVLAAVFMSAASLNAIGQNGLVGTNSTVTSPGAVSLTL
jgi:ABC-type transport system involved in cytochrome c biogenesis permease component